MNDSKESGSVLRIMTHNIWIPPLYNRSTLLHKIYKEYDPDILCLQEITPVIHDSGFLDGFDGKYTIVLPRIGEYYNNTPVLFRNGMFSLLGSGWHLFDGRNNNDTKSVTWAVLEHVSGGRIGICSAHFWYDTKSYEDDLCRRYDAEQCMTYIDKILAKYNVPVILMGDLNCTVTSPAYRYLMSRGGMDARMAAEKYDDRINTFHDSPHLDPDTQLYSGGAAPQGTHLDAIDHMIIFGQEKLAVRSLNVLTQQAVLDSSDHCPVYMDAEIKRKKRKKTQKKQM